METTIHNLNGDKADTLELPAVFETPYRPDVIERAVVAAQGNRRQPEGEEREAGMRRAAGSFASGRSMGDVAGVEG